MSLQIAIVGLPNVGKSTLFNALTKNHTAQAENYPFCTIDPNVGVVELPDERLNRLAELVHPEKIIPAIVEFVDVAGLVKGASEGEGLGNQFLAHIRQCNAIAHLVRFFEETDVIHVHESVHPKRDREIIESELLLADLQTLEKRMHKAAGDARSGDKEKKIYYELLEKVNKEMQSGHLAIQIDLNKDEKKLLQDLHLITMKPMIYVVNMDESRVGTANLEEIRCKLEIPESATIIPISAKVEAELIGFSDEEARDYLKTLGLNETGLNRVIKEAFKHLGLQTYFTAGQIEVRAWTIKQGIAAPQAAGVIHTDFEKGFIRAEVISYEDYIECGGEQAAKEKGLMRLEGKEYIVKDGDIIHFRFSN
ncbi:redox-regulated ATPase YchF [Patescibacteria group bacterium]|nr:redox-regulated ATPase YchF [Patescibacteria group bacterium]